MACLKRRDCGKIPSLPPSSRGLGRSPFKAKTGVRISLGALRSIELLDMPVEQFFALIRFEQRDLLSELNAVIKKSCLYGLIDSARSISN